MNVLIVGASRGIGLEFVRQYREQGANVTATARSDEGLAGLHPGWVRTDMGGAGADISAAQSVADMRHVLAALTPADNGRFINHDGSTIAW